MMKRIGLCLLLLTMIFLTACENKNNKILNEQTETFLYYIDNNATKIVSQKYTPVGNTKEELVDEYITALRKEPESMFYRKALPDNITIKEFIFNEDNSLTINFDSSYNEFKGIAEVLCRATIVKTLCQIDGVEYIVFNVNGQQLKDSNEKFVGIMTADDFLSNTGTETNYQIALFFANQDGTKLIEHTKNIYYSGTGTMEEQVIKQIINGPTDIGMNDTIPEGTILLNVTTKEGICYVDFNEKFLDKIPGISDEVAIYSVVNSLVELPSINKVQFLINAEVKKTYRESIPFDGLFERNLSIVE